jgi:hypothetical protein
MQMHENHTLHQNVSWNNTNLEEQEKNLIWDHDIFRTERKLSTFESNFKYLLLIQKRCHRTSITTFPGHASFISWIATQWNLDGAQNFRMRIPHHIHSLFYEYISQDSFLLLFQVISWSKKVSKGRYIITDHVPINEWQTILNCHSLHCNLAQELLPLEHRGGLHIDISFKKLKANIHLLQGI